MNNLGKDIKISIKEDLSQNIEKTNIEDLLEILKENYSKDTQNRLNEDKVLKGLREQLPRLINNLTFLQNRYNESVKRNNRSGWIESDYGIEMLNYAKQAYQLIEHARSYFTGEVFKYAIQVQNGDQLDVAVVSFDEISEYVKLMSYHGNVLKLQISKSQTFVNQLKNDNRLLSQTNLELVQSINNYYETLLNTIWAYYAYKENDESGKKVRKGKLVNIDPNFQQSYNNGSPEERKRILKQAGLTATIQQGYAFEAALSAAIYSGKKLTNQDLLNIYIEQMGNIPFFKSPDIYLNNDKLNNAGKKLLEKAEDIQGLQLKSFANSSAQLVYLNTLPNILTAINIIINSNQIDDISDALNKYIFKSEKNTATRVLKEVKKIFGNTLNKYK